MAVQSVNAVVRAYFMTFQDYREEWPLSDFEEDAYQRLAEAYARIEEYDDAPVDDLCLHEAVLTAHRAMRRPPDKLPTFSCVRPSVRIGRQWSLNSVIISYFHRFLKYCQHADDRGELLDSDAQAFDVIQEAFERIEASRNAAVDDLPLLEAIHTAHRSLGLHGSDIPHFDVSRRYEGQTAEDGLDARARIVARQKQEGRRAVQENGGRHLPTNRLWFY